MLLIALGSSYHVFSVGSIWDEAKRRPLAQALIVVVPRAWHAITTAGMNTPRSGDGSTTVSVLGLGMLGASLARAFLDHGHATTVWNRSSVKADELVGRGAVRAATAEEAVAASQVVVVCVSDYAAARSILDTSAESGSRWCRRPSYPRP